MKTLLIIIGLSLICYGVAHGQLFKKEENLVNAKKNTYRIVTINEGAIIRPKTPDLVGKKLSYNSDLDMSGLDTKQTSKQIFAQVSKTFSDERKRELSQRNESLGINLFVLPNGKIKEIEFFVAKNRLMTLSEIEDLDEAIRKNVTVPVTKPNLYKGIPFIVFLAQPIRFSKLFP